jgi:hypothetical protein
VKKAIAKEDSEIAAIGVVFAALKGLDKEAASRVINYVAKKIGIEVEKSKDEGQSGHETENSSEAQGKFEEKEEAAKEKRNAEDASTDGISPIAKKWIIRNGIETSRLSKVFSIGHDEIDLIAKSVPGAKKKDRMHNVFLLKGVASYLSSGTARFTHEQLKEACLHYDAYDVSNFAAYYKTMSGDVSGSKESGYTLTARGLSSATELIKEIGKSPDK